MYRPCRSGALVLVVLSATAPLPAAPLLPRADSQGDMLPRLDMRHLPPGATRVVFLPDGKRLALAYRNDVRICAVAGGKELLRLGPIRDVERLAASPDGKLLAVAHKGSVDVWDLAAASRRFHFAGKPWLKNRGLQRELLFTSDSKVLFSGWSADGMRRWDMTTGKPLPVAKEFPRWNCAQAVSRDGLSALICRDYFYLWDLRSGTNQDAFCKWNWQTQLAFSPDGTTVAALSFLGKNSRSMGLFDVRRGRHLRMLDVPYAIWRSFGSGRGIEAVAFAPDGKSLAAIVYGGLACQWQTSTGKMVKCLDATKGHPNRLDKELLDLAFTPEAGRWS
jgi:WD40 repeat protein